MAYFVKPVNGEEKKMELAEIHEALKGGALTEQWLVRDERQDFWYSVGKLVGKVSSNPIEQLCPKCQARIAARRIDIGLPASCPKCETQVVIIDPDAVQRRLRDRAILASLKQRAILGASALALGLVISVGSFVFAKPGEIWFFWWGPFAFGLGTFAICFPQYLDLKRKLQQPPR